VSAGRKRRGLWIALAVIIALAAALWIGLSVYASGYSHCEETAKVCMAQSNGDADGVVTFGEDTAKIGIILYPGGLVDEDAYAPLASLLMQSGLFVAIPSMPYHLAVFDVNCAAEIIAKHPNVERWVVGGHSLGGAMAASFAAGHSDDVCGVILLAAYSTEPLNLPVLSVYGDLDTVLDANKYASYRKNLPKHTTELVISGGNHAQFGDYGEQQGDTPAAISNEEQWRLTADVITTWLTGLPEKQTGCGSFKTRMSSH